MLNFISPTQINLNSKIQTKKTSKIEKIKIFQRKKPVETFVYNTTNSFIDFKEKNNNLEPEIWEIDFFSKPVLNEKGKKLWELVIVNNKGTFEHVESVPNNLINSKELRKRINFVIKSAKVKPTTIKFFRTQMFNMINIALSELELNVRPSRKTRLLSEKLKERENSVYKKMEGFKPFLREIVGGQNLQKTPEKMPDFLRGDSYIFATIEISSLKEVIEQRPMFLEIFQPSFPINQDFSMPGLIILSGRAKSLSSWLNSIELFGVECDIEKKDLILECGLDTQYLFGKIKKDQYKESRVFEENKKKSNGLHFIAVQSNSSNQEIVAFWLLQ
jgi:hypothetical protein